MLAERLASAPLTVRDLAAATDFAIDANDAGRPDLSIALLEPLTERAPGHARLWQMLGLAYRDAQRMDAALGAFEKAAQLAPDDLRIALGRAQSLLEAGRPASQHFRAIRAKVPDDGEIALSAAASLVNEARGDAAQSVLEKLLERQRTWQRGHDALATLRWMQGDQMHFDRSYAAAAKAMPTDLPLRLAWYRAAAQVSQWDKAKAILADGRRIFGDRLEFAAAEAHIATETDDDPRAETLFELAAQLDDPGTKVSHIRHCLRTGRVDQAQTIALPMTKGPMANAVWPYLSTIWRLLDDPGAQWLDGDPVYVQSVDLPINAGELSALAELLRSLHRSRQHPPEQSMRGGTQTEGHLFLRLEPEISAIRAMIRDAVQGYVAQLPARDADHPLLGPPRGNLLFAGAWSVRLSAQGFHVCHTHPVGWISSALYVALPEPASMGPAPAGWLQLGAPPPNLRTALPPYMRVEPKPGRLVLFPSTLWHGTEPFDDGERLTIAFDVAQPLR